MWMNQAVGTRLQCLGLVAVLGACWACGDRESADSEDAVATSLSPTARPDIVETLSDDLAARRHPSDGGGRAWLEEGAPRAVAGQPGTWTVVYEAGSLGIAEGGVLFFQAPPFWGWSPPQVSYPEAPGFTEITTPATDVELRPETLGEGLLAIHVGARPLSDGERVRITYGAGPQGARADRYAERDSPFWIGVDGDGDGIRGLVPDPPTVDVGRARRSA